MDPTVAAKRQKKRKAPPPPNPFGDIQNDGPQEKNPFLEPTNPFAEPSNPFDDDDEDKVSMAGSLASSVGEKDDQEVTVMFKY